MQDATETLITQLIDSLRKTLPPVFTRQYVVEQLGGLVSVGGLANLESGNKGPDGVKYGKYVLYEKESFLHWLDGRIRSFNKDS